MNFRTLLTVLALTLLASLSACKKEEEGTMEKMGKAMDEAAHDTAEAVDEEDVAEEAVPVASEAAPSEPADRGALQEAMDLYRVTESWDEDTVTWNKRPGSSSCVWASLLRAAPKRRRPSSS